MIKKYLILTHQISFSLTASPYFIKNCVDSPAGNFPSAGVSAVTCFLSIGPFEIRYNGWIFRYSGWMFYYI